MEESKIASFFKKYVDFNAKSALIFLVLTILSIVILYFCGIHEIEENSLLENLQLVVLFAGVIYCFTVKTDKEYKPINIFFALVTFLLAMREMSYGRIFFAQIPGTNDFYHWSHYKYGYLAEVFVGIYIVAIFIYAFLKKAFVKIWEVLQKTRLPFWDLTLFCIAIPVQWVAEKVYDCTLVEEMVELLLYCLIVYMIYNYNNQLKIKN